MKKIASFKIKENYGNKVSYVEVVYSKEHDLYILCYKYSTMKEESIRTYKGKDLAMYDFNKKIMFLLS